MLIVNPELVVEMGAGCRSGAPYIANKLSLFDSRPPATLFSVAREVCVEG